LQSLLPFLFYTSLSTFFSCNKIESGFLDFREQQFERAAKKFPSLFFHQPKARKENIKIQSPVRFGLSFYFARNSKRKAGASSKRKSEEGTKKKKFRSLESDDVTFHEK